MLPELLSIQQELKAPKGQFNSFGNYRYRSCEDILEALKPLLSKYKCTLTISDEVVNVGDRIYIKATSTLQSTNGKEFTTAFAREPLDKKGMDHSQLSGMASSYARKYSLNGLFCIDDTKDADSMDNSFQEKESKPSTPKPEKTGKVGAAPSFKKDKKEELF